MYRIVCIIFFAVILCQPGYSSLDTDLMSAVRKKDSKQVELLLSQGAKPDRGLFTAARNKDKEMVDLLLSKGAKPDRGLYPAVKNKDKEMVDFLLSKGAKPGLGLFIAIKNNDKEMVDFLLSKGAKPSSYDIAEAEKSGNAEIVQLLKRQTAENGASGTVRTPVASTATPAANRSHTGSAAAPAVQETPRATQAAIRSHNGMPTKTVEAEGMGETLELAMKNARENAVRKAFGEVVDSVTEVKNDQLIESTISASAGFVLSSKMIGTPRYDEQNKFYTVRTQTVVATERLKAEIIRFKKTTANADVLSQLQASAVAEVQEKNAMKVLEYLAFEGPKTIQVKMCSYDIKKKGALTLHCDYTCNQEKLSQIWANAAKVLMANGYHPINKESSRDHYIDKYPGSVIVLDGDPYNNPQAILFYNAWDREYWKHPQNACFQMPCWSTVEVGLMDAQSNTIKSVVCGIDRLFRPGSYRGTPEYRCQGVFFHSYGSDTLREMRREIFIEVPQEKWKDIAKIVFWVNYKSGTDYQTAEFAKLVAKWPRPTIAEFPLSGADLVMQSESQNERAKQYVALLSKFHRGFFKTIQPKVEFKYDRFKDAGVLTLDLSLNKREYVRSCRSLAQKLEDLGLEKKKGIHPYDMKYNTVAIATDFGTFIFPEDGGATNALLEKELSQYQYRLVVNCKDKAGEVLQQVKIEIPDKLFYWYHHSAKNKLNYCDTSFHDEMTVKFDIPEDVKNVATVDAFIEERVKR